MTKLTCEDALDDYYREHVIRKVVDARRQRIAINHLNIHLGTVEVQNLTPDLIDQYCLDRAPTAGATQRRELNVLRAALRHAVAPHQADVFYRRAVNYQVEMFYR